MCNGAKLSGLQNIQILMCLQRVQRIQGVHEHQEIRWYHGNQLCHPYQGVRGVQRVPEEEITT